MWNLVRDLRASGVTIILTTHYIQEAEEMADRVGVVNHGELIVVDETASLMKKLVTPCARLRRATRSTSSAVRVLDRRPCTLMMVQKLQR